MNGLIRASLSNPYAVTVFCLTILLIGTLCLFMIPVDILPVFKSPAVQVLTFYGGMPAEGMEKDITSRMERWVGQANGMARQESRSIVGASIVRDYFQGDVDPNGAPDPGQLAGPGLGPQPAAGHAAAGGPAVRPDQLDADRPGRPEQRDRERVDALRRRPVRSPEHDHGPARAPWPRWSTAARSAP